MPLKAGPRDWVYCPTPLNFSGRSATGTRLHTFAPLSGFWASLSGVSFEAYEIRHGHTRPTEPAASQAPPLEAALPEHCGWQHGQTLAIYLHGMFESPAVMRGLFGRDTPTLDDTFNGLADFIDAHFAPGTLMSLLELIPPHGATSRTTAILTAESCMRSIGST